MPKLVIGNNYDCIINGISYESRTGFVTREIVAK